MAGFQAQWAVDEFAGIDLNDNRLNSRAIAIATQLGTIGESSPDAMKGVQQPVKISPVTAGDQAPHDSNSKRASTADLDALYRFVRNPKVKPQMLLEPHFQSTIRRTTTHQRVLLVQDTTEVNLTKPKRQVRGAGPLSSNSSFGFYLHPLIAYTTSGVPLGSVACQHWTRDAIDCESSPQKKKKKRDSLPIERKESYRWLQMTRRGMQIARENPGTEYVGVSDSESDIGELLSESVLRPDNYHVIIRACQNRALAKATCTEEATRTEESTSTEEIRLARNIQQKLDQCPVRYTSSTQVRGRTAKTKVEHRSRQQSRDDRMADLEVRATTITLPVNLAATSDVTGRLVPSVITLNVVEVREPNPPEGEVAIHWILLTTLPIDTDEQVAAIVAAYKVRWNIESFFMTLKSGLHLEDLQYQELSRYMNVAVLLLVVAWRVQCLTQVGRDDPATPCDQYFDSAEWKAACLVAKPGCPLPATAPSMGAFMLLVARLGGYIHKPAQGPPGVRTIWRGIRRLDTLAIAYRAFGPDTIFTQHTCGL